MYSGMMAVLVRANAGFAGAGRKIAFHRNCTEKAGEAAANGVRIERASHLTRQMKRVLAVDNES